MPEPLRQPVRQRSDHATVEVETPELVVLSYSLAGIGSRAYAALIDYFISSLLFLGAVVLLEALGPGVGAEGSWFLAILVIAQFAIQWGYYVLWEGLADGQTPGKRRMGLRVVRDGGYSVDFTASAVRNLVRVIDMQPLFLYAVGMTSAVVSSRGKRLGDIAAGTIVVRESAQELTPSELATVPRPRLAAQPVEAHLLDDEYTILARFIERRDSLSRERRNALAAQLAGRFAAELGRIGGDGLSRRGTIDSLVALFESERAARAQGAAPTRARGAARERHAIIATRSPQWSAFAARLAEAQRRGLHSLGSAGVREFVAEYRDLSADLARLRTASRDANQSELFYLSRLVAGAHNLLYRGRRLTLVDFLRFILRTVPAEIVRSWRPVGLAATLLFLPMAITGVAVARDASVAETLLPPQMFDRAAEGARRAGEADEAYVDIPSIGRPVFASQIVANNVQVAYFAFAAGIAAGLPTMLLLIVNGVSIGAVMGLYAAMDIFRIVLAFVAPHGVLELFAICVAGGAGLLLGGALVIPGSRTRRRALVEEGRRAARMIAGVTLMLVVAGAIEGLISPIGWWPIEGKLAVSALTAVLLYLYLRGGAAARATAPRAP